jgi:hypothetical protein
MSVREEVERQFGSETTTDPTVGAFALRPASVSSSRRPGAPAIVPTSEDELRALKRSVVTLRALILFLADEMDRRDVGLGETYEAPRP